MPPKGYVTKRLKGKEPPGRVSAGAEDDISNVAVELGFGEADANNVAFLTIVNDAWETVQAHDVFARIVDSSASIISPGGAARKPLSDN